MFVVLGDERLSPRRGKMQEGTLELFDRTYDPSGVGDFLGRRLQTLNPSGVRDSLKMSTVASADTTSAWHQFRDLYVRQRHGNQEIREPRFIAIPLTPGSPPGLWLTAPALFLELCQDGG